METIEKGKAIELAVIKRETVNSKQCYIVETPDKRRQAISLIRFQFEEKDPEKLRCVVKDINKISGELTLEQDFGPLLRRFYESGKEYPFVVIREYLTGKKKKTFLLSDSYGFVFNLHEKADTKLYPHQHVRCLVDIKNDTLALTLSDASRQQSAKSKDLQQRITEAVNTFANTDNQSWDKNMYAELLFSSQEKKIYDEQCTAWLQNELLKAGDSMHDTLDGIHQVCLYLLEGCDILKNEKQDERTDLQERISDLLDLTERFGQAVEIVEKDECDSYIDSLLSKLRCSGYIYHPNHRLGILITIFALRKELMENRMEDLLDVIHDSTLDYWRQEPFRSAFIRLLEMYIKARRSSADLLSVSASSNVRSLIKALAVQLLLINTFKDDELSQLPCDVRLNRSMLYRYASYFLTRAPKTLLERSFRSLMEMGESESFYNWEDTKNVEVLANKLCAFADDEEVEEVDDLLQRVYKGQKAILRVGNGGVTIYPNTSDTVWPVLPEELNLWHQLQVLLPDSLSRKTRVGMDTLRPYKQMWTEIELSLFGEKKPVKQVVRKTLPDQGDEVHIRIDSVEGNTLHCIIEEDDCKGEGTMTLSDIVDWNPRIFDACFNDEGGYPLLMLAKVVSVTPDGECTFNMKRLIREWMHDQISYRDTKVMLVKSVLVSGTSISANGISLDGLAMTAAIPQDFDSPVKAGDFLEVIIDSYDDVRRSNVSVSALRHTSAQWSETIAFMNLVNNYADDVLDIDDDDRLEEVIQEDAELTPSYVKELIFLLDRQAAIEPTIRSFNYLGAARLLAMTINDKQMIDYYYQRMTLLEMLQDFSINEKVDAQKLEELQKAAPDIFAPGSQLRLRFMQIMAVSCQGHPERNHELWQMITEEKDEGLKELASMVLSWNFTSDKEMNRSQEEINARIFALLHLKQRKSTKKSFGRETKTVEFKTSLVYPPENHYRANLRLQTANIMKEVAAFLNAEGGTLYLGVNNEGVATGLENDLAFSIFCYSQDKYDIYFHNQVKKMLGLEANAHVNCEWEEMDDKPIYVVRVKPCPHVVMLNGRVYERQDTSSEPLSGAYLDEFIKKRPMLAVQFDPQKEADLKEEKPKDEKPKNTVQKKATSEKTSTSAWRSNVLFNWEADYVEPEAYLCFQPGNKFCLLNAEQPPYNTEEYALALAIDEKEKNSFLVAVYESGKVGRIPMKEILEKNLFTSYNHADEKMLFACPASEDDYLLTTLRDDSGYLHFRTDKVDTLQRVRITEPGGPLHPFLKYEVVLAEIIPARLAQYCKATPGKNLGMSALTGSGPQLRNNIRKELGIEILPEDE